jgi:hypothetical protein
MMSSPNVPYVLGGTQTEQQRLIAQAQDLEGPTRWMLDRIDLKLGLRAVDVGCGPIGIMNLLSERVGTGGIVIGVEREPRFFGTIAIQEFDFVSFACDPDHPSWNVLFNTWCDAFEAAGGGNLFIGRSLARLLRSAGAENVRVHAHANLPQVGEYQRTHILSLIESTQELMVGPGKLSAAELRDHVAALAKHLADPKTTLIDRLVVQAWGTKPV